MLLLITQGLGSAGDGSGSAALITTGLGSSGSPSSLECLALEVLAVTNFGSHLIVLFSAELQVSGPGLDPASYTFTGPTEIKATEIRILTPGHILRIDLTEQQTGGEYTVTLPSQGIMDLNRNLINGPFTAEFIGIGIPTLVQIAKSIDKRTLEVVFSEAVLEEDATIPSKYSITPPLAVTRAERISDFHYRLTTGPQALGQQYHVEISGIRDIHGNL
jgi:hypothetical protein